MNFDEPNYDQEHALHIFLIHGRQIQFVPVLGCMCRSDAAEIYDFPVSPEFLGAKIQDLFEEMDQRNLEFQENFKNHWLVPKGVNSWKKFEENSLSIFIECMRDAFQLFRFYPSKPRGFAPKSGTPDLIVTRELSNEDLGKVVIKQFDIIREDLDKSPKT